ncbi:LysR family transcriptional regulator [Limnobacter sp.]|uniref:LysR family transcriptional regulator n=1 Tax=Limnobacter sp. TaxID=2003368 RepID=UPI0025879E82|nr:LysR family transcriptional regulator [Limnobacter sp.]
MSKSILELRHLRTLLAIDQTGGLSRAADLLHLTQSAVSHQIKALEDHFDDALLNRSAGGTRFTPLGMQLLTLARQVLPEVDRVELNIQKMRVGGSGPLRIAVECHTCFDWLMPSMDVYRERWPEVELDIVSGFHADPVGLLHRGEAELAIVSEAHAEQGVAFEPLFAYEIVGVVANESPLAAKPWLEPADFADEVLITYPVPDDMLDVLRHFLHPANVRPHRRSSELTVALLQLVASKRGVSALPRWAVKPYVDRQYVTQLKLGSKGLQAELHAAMVASHAHKPYMQDFVRIMREVSLKALEGVRALSNDRSFSGNLSPH